MTPAIGDLGRRLLRQGLAHLTAERDACSVCHRTPLVGERVSVYANGSIACALCDEAKRGVPEQTRLVLHSELGHAVKPLPRIAL